MKDALLVEKAFAKINLGLKVLGRRPDGYHEIRSIMQSVDLADLLSFGMASHNKLSCTAAELPTGPENLVWRAMKLFYSRFTGSSHPLHLHLEKHIPIAAGLGGGSADAAAALRGLNRLYDLPFTMESLRRMGATLGSDIPFLIEGGTALAGGRGELLTPLRWPTPVFYVLVYPEVSIATSWAYSQLVPDLTGGKSYINFISSLTSGGCVDCDALITVLENDFQPVVERAYPIVAQLRSKLDLAGARTSSLSGSGSTVYGIFDDRETAFQAHQELQGHGYRSFLCRPSPVETRAR